MIEEIFKNAEIANGKNDGDYYNNGLLYCGKCHTPKEYILGGSSTYAGKKFPIMCRCKSEEFENRKLMKQKQEREERISQNRDFAFKNCPKLKNATFESGSFNPNGKISTIKKYVEYFNPEKSKNLIFYGDCGTGKSFISACIANALIEKGFKIVFRTIPEIANELWNANDKQLVFDRISAADLLVIDDFGAERTTDFENEIRYNVVNARYSSGKTMIVTTNLSPQTILSNSDLQLKRVLSRIVENAVLVPVVGADRRMNNVSAI